MSSYTKEKLQRLLADVITHRKKSTIADIDLILRAGGDPNEVVNKGLRPLHYAAFENYVEAVEMLIERGADVNKGDDIGYTPLHVASKHGNTDSVKLLIERGAMVDHFDVHGDTSKTTRALAELTVNPLNLALEHNHADIADILLSNGADANQSYFLGPEITMLPLENIKCLHVLLKHGADPNAVSRCGLSTLMKACKQQHPEAVRLLLDHGADIDALCPPKFDQKRALHFAVMSGNVGIVRQLLEAGANTTRPPEYSCTPLECSILQDKYDICKVLIEHGVDIDETNQDNCSPLQTACSTLNLKVLKRRRDIVELLLQYGANPNYHGREFSYMGPSLSPLVEYFSYNDEYDAGLVKLLLEYGAGANICHPTKFFRIRDASGLLTHIRKLRPYEEIFTMILEAARFFDLEAIMNDSSLSNGQRELLLEKATNPRSLKHQARLNIRDCLHLPKPILVETLPIPRYIKDYILFNKW